MQYFRTLFGQTEGEKRLIFQDPEVRNEEPPAPEVPNEQGGNQLPGEQAEDFAKKAALEANNAPKDD